MLFNHGRLPLTMLMQCACVFVFSALLGPKAAGNISSYINFFKRFVFFELLTLKCLFGWTVLLLAATQEVELMTLYSQAWGLHPQGHAWLDIVQRNHEFIEGFLYFKVLFCSCNIKCLTLQVLMAVNPTVNWRVVREQPCMAFWYLLFEGREGDCAIFREQATLKWAVSRRLISTEGLYHIKGAPLAPLDSNDVPVLWLSLSFWNHLM